jgi:DNA replication initiation complex subunit (GINS family)
LIGLSQESVVQRHSGILNGKASENAEGDNSENLAEADDVLFREINNAVPNFDEESNNGHAVE